MIAITAVVKAIKGLGGVAVLDEAQELQQLVDGTTSYLTKTTFTNAPTIQTVNKILEQDR
jgi:hypothetical protein